MLLKECQKFRFTLLAVFLLGIGLVLITSSSCSSQTKENHIARGEQLLEKRKFEEAAMEFRSALEIDSGSAAAHWGLARAYENMGLFLETVEELHRVVDLQPENLAARAKLGNYFLLFEPPQKDEVRRILGEIFDRDPNFIEGHILKASLLAAEGRPESEILNAFDRALALDRKRTETYVSLSRYFVREEKTAAAEKALQKAIAAAPARALGYIEYGRFLTFAERFDEAAEQFQKAVKVEPRDIEAREALAKFYTARGDFDRAEKAYLGLVEIEENSAESLMQLGNFYVFAGRDNEALKTFYRILTDTPGYVRARYRLAEIYLDRRETGRATEQVDELFSLNDNDTEAVLLRARIDLQKDQAGAAVGGLEEVLKQKPRQKDALFYMTQAKLALGQIDQARAFIGDLEKYHPQFQRTKLLRIQASFAAGEIESALQSANRLLRDLERTEMERRKTSENLWDLKMRALTARGLAYLQLGQMSRARPDLEQAARMAPHSAAALVNLARVSEAEQNPAEALELYEKALAADGRNFDALAGATAVLIRQGSFSAAHEKIDRLAGEKSLEKNFRAALHYLKSNVYKAEGNFSATESELNRALQADEAYLPAYAAYAALLIGRNRIDEAIRQYRKSVEQKPSAPVYTLIGMLEDARENYSAAEQNYRRALKIEPDSPIAANNLAWLIAANDSGSLDEALRLARSSVRQNPNIAGYNDTLGWVYYKKGLYSPAVEHLQKAVALDNAAAARSGEKPNAEYRQRLDQVLKSAS